MGSPLLQLTALLLLPALAAGAGRRTSLGLPISVVTIAGSALALLTLPADSAVSPLLALSAFGRGACWVSLLGATLAVFAMGDRRSPGGPNAGLALVWILHLLAVGTILVTRSPLLLLLMILLVAALIPRLGAGGDGWRRALAIGGLVVFAGLLCLRVAPPPLTDLAIAGVLVLGFVLLLGAFPFAAATLMWLTRSGPRLASAAATSLGPALLTVYVDNIGEFSHLSLARPSRVGLTLAFYGAATLLAAAVYTFRAQGWHDLAAAGVVADLGLALSAAAAGSVGAAALVLVVMALTRPLMFLLEGIDMRRRWARVGATGALLGASGMPPTVGFAARLLVLAAAFRLGPALAGAVLAGVLLALVASTRVVLARLREVTSPQDARPTGRAEPLAVIVALLLSIGAGAFPAAVLIRVWGIG